MSPGLRVRDLLEVSHLRLSLVAGASGLDRPVSWSHTSELPDPGAWLEGGELLITNGTAIADTARAQASYLRRLRNANAAGLALGVQHSPLVPAFSRVADELALTVVQVPREVPFVAITRHVADATASSATRRLQTHLRIFDLLRPLAEGDLSPAQSISRLGEIIGYELDVVTHSGRPLLEAAAPPLPAVLDDARRAIRNGAVIADGYAVAIPVRGQPAPILIARECGGQPGAGLSAVRHAATVVALELAMLQHELDGARERGGWIFQQLARGGDHARATLPLLEGSGLSRELPWVVAAARTARRASLATDVAHQLEDRGDPYLIESTNSQMLLLVHAETDLESLVEAHDVRIGVSRTFGDPTRVGLARMEALWALRRIDGAPPRLAEFGQDDGLAGLLPTNLGALQGLIDRVLEPVIAYDREHQSALMTSLDVFFAQDRRLNLAAETLHVHKHTLAYRLKRVESLTGLDLSTVSSQAQVWLALEARRVVSGATGSVDAAA